LQAAAQGKVSALVVESHRTLILEMEEVKKLAMRNKITVWGHAGKAVK
jgi:DUF1009 family protein